MPDGKRDSSEPSGFAGRWLNPTNAILGAVVTLLGSLIAIKTDIPQLFGWSGGRPEGTAAQTPEAAPPPPGPSHSDPQCARDRRVSLEWATAIGCPDDIADAGPVAYDNNCKTRRDLAWLRARLATLVAGRVRGFEDLPTDFSLERQGNMEVRVVVDGATRYNLVVSYAGEGEARDGAVRFFKSGHVAAGPAYYSNDDGFCVREDGGLRFVRFVP
jgi:hypothetical protein